MREIQLTNIRLRGGPEDLEEIIDDLLKEGFGYKVGKHPVLKNEILGPTLESTEDCFVYLFEKDGKSSAQKLVLVKNPGSEEYLLSEYKIIK